MSFSRRKKYWYWSLIGRWFATDNPPADYPQRSYRCTFNGKYSLFQLSSLSYHTLRQPKETKCNMIWLITYDVISKLSDICICMKFTTKKLLQNKQQLWRSLDFLFNIHTRISQIFVYISNKLRLTIIMHFNSWYYK